MTSSANPTGEISSKGHELDNHRYSPLPATLIKTYPKRTEITT
jgi:hypothetical protein